LLRLSEVANLQDQGVRLGFAVAPFFLWTLWKRKKTKRRCSHAFINPGSPIDIECFSIVVHPNIEKRSDILQKALEVYPSPTSHCPRIRRTKMPD